MWFGAFGLCSGVKFHKLDRLGALYRQIGLVEKVSKSSRIASYSSFAQSIEEIGNGIVTCGILLGVLGNPNLFVGCAERKGRTIGTMLIGTWKRIRCGPTVHSLWLSSWHSGNLTGGFATKPLQHLFSLCV